MIYILLNSLIISAWCLGFRTITDEGMILSFIRKPFEYLPNSNGRFDKLIYYIFKPIILCVVCFPSVHGTILYSLLNGFEWVMVISIVFSTFINSFVWNLYEKARQ